MNQSNLLRNLVEFNNKSRPRTIDNNALKIGIFLIKAT